MSLLKNAHSKPVSTVSLQCVTSGLSLWKNKHPDLLSSVSHDDIGLIRVLVSVQNVGVKSLILIHLTLAYHLMLYTSFVESLRHGLDDSLFEGVVTSCLVFTCKIN